MGGDGGNGPPEAEGVNFFMRVEKFSARLWPNSIRSILSKTCGKHVFDIVCNMFSTSF